MSNLSRRTAVGIGLAGLSVPMHSFANTALPEAPSLLHITSLHINVAMPQESGTIDGKRKRFIPITGGSMDGPQLRGDIMPGGGDWQSIHEDGLTDIYARYSLRTHDGVVIGITNPGVRVASADVTRRIAAGEVVSPSEYYFRSSPVFDVANGRYEWLRRKVFVARGIRKPDHVILEVFEVG